MGSTGRPDLPQARPEAIEALLRPVPREREACLAQAVEIWQVLSGSLRDDPERIREKAAREYDRAFYPQGMPRQFTAILANGNRKPRLSSVTAPTLVIHGDEDPLIPVEGGRDIAEAIPNAELLIIQGMGHSLPRAVWPQIVDAIAAHTTKKPAAKN
jgi:pimeloyl-ACP methyl ester carboxylesterase